MQEEPKRRINDVRRAKLMLLHIMTFHQPAETRNTTKQVRVVPNNALIHPFEYSPYRIPIHIHIRSGGRIVEEKVGAVGGPQIARCRSRGNFLQRQWAYGDSQCNTKAGKAFGLHAMEDGRHRSHTFVLAESSFGRYLCSLNARLC